MAPYQPLYWPPCEQLLLGPSMVKIPLKPLGRPSVSSTMTLRAPVWFRLWSWRQASNRPDEVLVLLLLSKGMLLMAL